jgi:hypothetical protein
VSPDHIGGVYNVIDFVTGQPHMTHQLGRATDVVRPFLLEQHPWLSEISVPDGLGSEEKVYAWLATATNRWGESHEVKPMSPGMYVGRDPLEELMEMAPHAEIIPVVVPDRSDG